MMAADRIEEVSLNGFDPDFSLGQPLQVITTGEGRTFELDVEALESILLQENIRDKKVVVLSVAGAFRKGKSFLLDFFLRYMAADGSPDWMGDDTTPLTGFSWRGGSERETTGILMWSKVFLVNVEDGDQLAVLLMDTQGAFDSESTVKECATVFALSTMISSVQVYNLSQNIQEDDLQHLQLFTEYGRLAMEDNSKLKPFQKLVFLVRDWSFPYEAEYGYDGGQKILDRRLMISERQHPQLQQLRKHIRSCFSSIGCFLLPHPGLKVATNPHFDGRLLDIENEFKSQLRALVPMLLQPQNLVPKEIDGRPVTARELVEYFKAYVQIYKGDELPEPKSMLEATAEANNLAAVASAKDVYTSNMEKVCGGDRPYIKVDRLIDEHAQIKEAAMEVFNSRRKMGGEEFSAKYKEKLETDLEEMFGSLCKQNDSKNLRWAARTPIIIGAYILVFYIFSAFFGLFGAYSMANFSNLAMFIGFVMLILWVYVKYSGDLIEVGEQIDYFVSLFWSFVLQPIYQTLVPDHAQVTIQALSNSTGLLADNNANQTSPSTSKQAKAMNRSLSNNGKVKES